MCAYFFKTETNNEILELLTTAVSIRQNNLSDGLQLHKSSNSNLINHVRVIDTDWIRVIGTDSYIDCNVSCRLNKTVFH